MKVTKDIKYIGVNDHNIDLFEGQYIVPNGMAYNSYVILDEKICVMDSVDTHFSKIWLDNLKKELNGRIPNYLVVQHMEPDHSGSIMDIIKEYPNIIVVSSKQAFTMMKQFFGVDFENQRIVVKEGDVLDLGAHKLSFIGAPMVHWPEVIMTYDSKDKILFSADAFGKFGALDIQEEWACEARRYYIGIVGKYGAQVQNVLKKASSLDIQIICPLHGPVLSENLDYYLNLYDIWSSYKVEEKGVLISYCSIYGNTKQAVLELEALLKARGHKVVVNDLARVDMAEAIEDAFRYSHHIFASSTYNMDVFPFMNTFIHGLVERNYQNRVVGFIENGSWMPNATKVMKSLLEKSKNLTYLNTEVRILSSLNEDSRKQLMILSDELSK
ncbi:MAG: FprA family A-type flavoprotein [Erysipelotrichaceae bacterium]|nr:FprA family A-type flavoprotein [Erysipelotrichaceae bacterium]